MKEYSRDLIEQMRGWLMDCEWADYETEDFEEMTDRQIVRGVARHNDGGLAQFERDNEGVEVPRGWGSVNG